MSAIDKIHNLSLRLLTLCGFGALVCLAVNLITALTMRISDVCKKRCQTTSENRNTHTVKPL